MSLPEVLLWQRLKARPEGLKFRKQHPAAQYILDFYCHEAWLVIEVDGVAHDMGNGPERDEARGAHLQQRGLRVIRISAADVLRDPDEAVATIVAYAQGGA